ncbi:MAG: enolase C-terminal domain-like protein [Pseudomonadota bacterium]
MSGVSETISAIDLWHLYVPVTATRDHGIGRVAREVEVVVVRLRSSGGAVGYGEAACWSVFTGTPEGAFAAINRYFRPHVIGARCDAIPEIMAKVRKAVAFQSDAKAALETALYDLLGRIKGVPVWALLGGKSRDEIPLSVSLANPDFAADLDLAAQLETDGVRLVKLKAGVADHAFDLKRFDALAERHPCLEVRVDYNQGLTPHEAAYRVREMDAAGPAFIEQPVAASEFGLMRRLRETSETPILADESVFGPEDMHRAVAEGICDGVSVKVMKAGGLSRAQTVANMASAAGLTAYGGDMFETGLGHLAGVHTLAATPAINLGCEFYQAKYYLTEDILTDPFPIKNGNVVVPDGPGLGILPDEEKLAHFARRTTVKH